MGTRDQNIPVSQGACHTAFAAPTSSLMFSSGIDPPDTVHSRRAGSSAMAQKMLCFRQCPASSKLVTGRGHEQEGASETTVPGVKVVMVVVVTRH